MKHDVFSPAVRSHAGLVDEAATDRAIRATLHELGRYLTTAQANIVQVILPQELAPSLSVSDPNAEEFDLEWFYRAISLREGVRLGIALEHAQAVCQVLAQSLDEPERERLVEALPPELARLLTPREESPASEPLAHAPPTQLRNTLSTGRAGSSRPLSEAGPYAHQHSIAVEGKPSKPHPETLSTGRPGSKRPISESH